MCKLRIAKKLVVSLMTMPSYIHSLQYVVMLSSDVEVDEVEHSGLALILIHALGHSISPPLSLFRSRDVKSHDEVRIKKYG